jgi:outer membrane protein OmpA-like peptidoglycan-associated protein
MRIQTVLLPLLFVSAPIGLMVACGGGQAEVKVEAKASAEPPPPAPPASSVAETPAPPAPPAPSTPPPAPPAPPKVTLRGLKMKSATQIDMPGAIDFESGSTKIKLSAASKKVLTAIVDALKKNPEITKLSVEGNTDNAGEDKGFDNVKLSKERAEAVVEYLTKTGGIDAGRLQAVGYGSQHPLAANDTPDHKAQNRRVEFHVLGFNGADVPKEEVAPPAPPAPAPPKAAAAPAKGK